MKAWIVIASLAVASPIMFPPSEELTPSVLSVSDDIPTSRLFCPVAGNDAAMAVVDQDSGLPPFDAVAEVPVIEAFVDLWGDGEIHFSKRK
jgi:hypothetical protein